MSPIVLGVTVWLLGLCIGSFLNVVIYRLPLGLSVGQPRWSFCPNCRSTLKWFENLPVLSWLVLRGRCRTCGVGISVQYPLVEAVTGLAFVLAWRLLFIEGAHRSVGAAITPTDLPLMLAWMVLIAAMVATSAMDMVSYMIDVAVTNFAVVAGVVILALWPRSEFLGSQAATPWAAGGAVAMIVGIVVMLARGEPSQGETEADGSPPEAEATKNGSPVTRKSPFVPGAVATIAMAGFALWLLAIGAPGSAPTAGADVVGIHDTEAVRQIGGGPVPSVVAAFLVLIAAIVMGTTPQREVDQELEETIEEEAPQARSTALRELAGLSPALLAGIGTWLLIGLIPAVASGWDAIARFQIGGFAPIAGTVYSLFGAAVGAAMGWSVRIVFTLAFGREAFGVGDIYILAAAGATAGPEIAALGFILSIGVALFGWVVTLLMKRSVMIPFGPPLAVGFLLALWLHKPAARLAGHYVESIAATWAGDPRMILLLAGVLGVGAAMSILVARVVRGLVERGGPEKSK